MCVTVSMGVEERMVLTLVSPFNAGFRVPDQFHSTINSAFIQKIYTAAYRLAQALQHMHHNHRNYPFILALADINMANSCSCWGNQRSNFHMHASLSVLYKTFMQANTCVTSWAEWCGERAG